MDMNKTEESAGNLSGSQRPPFHLHNHTDNHTSHSTGDFITEIVFLSVIGIIGLVGNGTVLVYNIFLKKRSMMRPLEVLVMNSTAADFIICCFFIPLQVGCLCVCVCVCMCVCVCVCVCVCACMWICVCLYYLKLI